MAKSGAQESPILYPAIWNTETGCIDFTASPKTTLKIGGLISMQLLADDGRCAGMSSLLKLMKLTWKNPLNCFKKLTLFGFYSIYIPYFPGFHGIGPFCERCAPAGKYGI